MLPYETSLRVIVQQVCRVDAASTPRKVVAAAEIRVANYGAPLLCHAMQSAKAICFSKSGRSGSSVPVLLRAGVQVCCCAPALAIELAG